MFKSFSQNLLSGILLSFVLTCCHADDPFPNEGIASSEFKVETAKCNARLNEEYSDRKGSLFEINCCVSLLTIVCMEEQCKEAAFKKKFKAECEKKPVPVEGDPACEFKNSKKNFTSSYCKNYGRNWLWIVILVALIIVMIIISALIYIVYNRKFKSGHKDKKGARIEFANELNLESRVIIDTPKKKKSSRSKRSKTLVQKQQNDEDVSAQNNSPNKQNSFLSRTSKAAMPQGDAPNYGGLSSKMKVSRSSIRRAVA